MTRPNRQLAGPQKQTRAESGMPWVVCWPAPGLGALKSSLVLLRCSQVQQGQTQTADSLQLQHVAEGKAPIALLTLARAGVPSQGPRTNTPSGQCQTTMEQDPTNFKNSIPKGTLQKSPTSAKKNSIFLFLKFLFFLLLFFYLFYFLLFHFSFFCMQLKLICYWLKRDCYNCKMFYMIFMATTKNTYKRYTREHEKK